ncbi:Uncharacterised protein [BD1-7 clade bacterium]|uniref:Type VI secretion system baseplate subunit TssG n=1 Tax=BD1-7 clade bacterium TaxID=2029982 RepID=A0A5S9NY80_9GAMM|nr:Uncharacterised protein [BD1-7 clade bacterium]CAA0095753.1 Uncharacterised protein [BD1-7 clade bacterium]
MECKQRQSGPDLTTLEKIAGAPWSVGFFDTLRVIDATFQDLPRLGESGAIRNDIARLSQPASLAFEGRDIASLQMFGKGESSQGVTGPDTDSYPSAPEVSNSGDDHIRDTLLVECMNMGCWGPNGILPLHMTENAYREHTFKTPNLEGFADIFHHRMLSLFYRVFADSQPTIALDRPDTGTFDEWIGALAGCADPEIDDQAQECNESASNLTEFRWAKLFHAGLLSRGIRSAEGLRQVLSSVLKLPVEVDDGKATWMTFEQNDRSFLGGGQVALGQTSYLGERILALNGNIAVCVGPVSESRLKRFLPGQEDNQTCHRWLRSYCGFSYRWTLVVLVESQPGDGATLGGDAALGWQSWLGHRYSRVIDIELPA